MNPIAALLSFLVTVTCHPISLVFVGGGLGSVARYLTGRWFASLDWAAGFPWATLVINTLGSFLLAAFALCILKRLPPAQAPLFLLLGTGFCGGFTTFSTYEWEAYALWRDGKTPLALAYLIGSVATGLLAVLLAVVLFSPSESET